jgi:diguanylate cyclase (GGDEF)-like protein
MLNPLEPGFPPRKRLISSITLLVVSAAGVLLFTLFAGALTYSNSRKLISEADWVRHSLEVLATLENIALLAERIEYRSRTYALNGSADEFSRAQSSATQLAASVLHLQAQVADNPFQTAHASALIGCSQALSASVERLRLDFKSPAAELQDCRQTIRIMIDHEQSLLADRSRLTQRTSLDSVIAELCFAILALVTLTVLFSLLLRDAFLRRGFGKQSEQHNDRLAESVKALERQARESQLLTAVRDELQLCAAAEQVYRAANKGLSQLLPGTSGALGMINNSRQLVEVVSSWEGDALPSQIEDFHPPECCCGLRSGQPRWRLPGQSEIDCTHFMGEPPERYLCVPIGAQGNTLGVLYVQCATDEIVASVTRQTDSLRQLLQLTGMTLAALALRMSLEHKSIRDGLTGLFNRNFMQVSLERELVRAARRKQILAVFMLDLDCFKQFNDDHGHPAGDAVLQAIGEVFRTSMRADDIACRYGGEEFTIIMPDTPQDVAVARAERIRRAIEILRLPVEHEILSEFTVSIGVALFPKDGETVEALIRSADLALYKAKHGGRNQIAVFEAEPLSPFA